MHGENDHRTGTRRILFTPKSAEIPNPGSRCGAGRTARRLRAAVLAGASQLVQVICEASSGPRAANMTETQHKGER